MTSSDKCALSFLAARDGRQESLAHALRHGYPATIFVALNLPGGDKKPSGSVALHAATLRQLAAAFPGLLTLASGCDALGPYAIVAVDSAARETKQRCMVIENGAPAARLVDLDVYTDQGVQLGRGELGLPARTCLACRQPAVDCMRVKRHPIDDIVAKANELLAPFRT